MAKALSLVKRTTEVYHAPKMHTGPRWVRKCPRCKTTVGTYELGRWPACECERGSRRGCKEGGSAA